MAEELKVEPVGRVCVVGAGASGLVVMKELKEVGIETTCFEMLPRIGGVYAKAYDNMLLTTSSLLTSYSSYSDGKEENPVFWTDVDYLRYLDAFADKYNLIEDIQFRTAVEEIRKCPRTGKWLVTVRGGRAVPEHRTYGAALPEDPTAEAVTHVFDAVAIAAGTNNWPAPPNFEGQELFKGEIVHADDFRHPQDYRGKRVAIVGGGESASDICNEISKYAAATCMVIREKHGHLIPRKQSTGRVTDLNTNRVRYSNPYILGDWIGWTNQQAKRIQAMCSKCTPEDAKVMKKIAEFNIGQNTSAFSKTGCKNTGFVEAIVLRGAQFHRSSFRLEADRMIFSDGQEFPCDAIIACTGYRNMFPYFDKYHPDLATEFGTNPRKLFKQIFPPPYKGEVAFFGFARPAFGSLPPTSEMQARYYAMVLNGEKELPSVEDMVDIAAKDKEEWDRRFKYDSPRLKGLVDFQLYADDLAKLMGVMPPLGKLFWADIKVWFKIMFGPFSMHQYRLVGPHATPDFSKSVLRRFPTGDILESTITASFLIVAKVLSLLGLKQFTPNNF